VHNGFHLLIIAIITVVVYTCALIFHNFHFLHCHAHFPSIMNLLAANCANFSIKMEILEIGKVKFAVFCNFKISLPTINSKQSVHPLSTQQLYMQIHYIMLFFSITVVNVALPLCNSIIYQPYQVVVCFSFLFLSSLFLCVFPSMKLQFKNIDSNCNSAT
jgi:hypothetical protein